MLTLGQNAAGQLSVGIVATELAFNVHPLDAPERFAVRGGEQSGQDDPATIGAHDALSFPR